MRVEVNTRGCFTISAASRDAGTIKRVIPGVRWSTAKSQWYAHPSRMVNAAILTLPRAEIDEAARALAAAPTLPPRRTFPPAYKFKTTPYAHQAQGIAHLFGSTRAAVFAEPGTGKTKMAIDAAAALWRADEIDALLVVCPLSVRSSWRDQMALHSPVPYEVQMVATKFDGRRLGPGGLRVILVGCESLSSGGAADRTMALFTANPGIRVAMVVDEAHMIKNQAATRTKKVKIMGAASRWRWILTGTPIANNIGDLYSQFDFLDPNIIGLPSYSVFMERYAIYGGFEGRQIVGWTRCEEVRDAIEPWIFRALKSECLDLPPKVYERREISMTPEQSKVYREMKRYGMSGTLTTIGTLDLALRLHQIAGGWMAHDDGKVTQISSKVPKIDELLSILDECEGQTTIVWCAYRHEVAAVVQAVSQRVGADRVVQIHGGVDEAGRAAAVAAIQSGAATVLVGTASAGGVGLTLTAATVTVYFSNTFKYVERVQSEDRNHRIGQASSVTIFDLVTAGTVDESIEKALVAKSDLAAWISQGGQI
jgi:hypothetical protein